MEDYELKASKWLNSTALSDEDKDEIKSLQKNDPAGFLEAFYRDLEFGTGGLRGIMGIGSNRVNRYTIGMATQGFSNYLKTAFSNQISVALAYDSRNNSQYFAEVAANVFSANGIKVYLFEELRPTPELSFAIRHLKCQGGVVLTASHNPKEYNGYKAYWDDGAQIVPPHDINIIKEVQKIDVDDVLFEGNSSLIQKISDEVDVPYLEMLSQLSLSKESIEKADDLKIVFSGIHGTGITMVPPILEKMGFKNVITVEEQDTPDGNFPTVVYPNPEEVEALALSLKKAESENADLVMATDPDADRVGIAVKDLNGKFILLNGNQTGSLLIYYLLIKWKENQKLTGSEYVVKTIVTTDLIPEIASHFGVKSYETLTGFKYIASLIKELEGKEKFVGGGEESYGYLIGDNVRDKDAVASCAIIAEMAAWSKVNGESLFELLIRISEEFGMYQEGLKSLTKKGKSGSEEIQAMMARFRNTPPTTLDGSDILEIRDYESSKILHLKSGKESSMVFPKSNVLQFITADNSKISIRPSGTEPKIKFYFSVKGDITSNSDYFATAESLRQKIDRLKVEIES